MQIGAIRRGDEKGRETKGRDGKGWKRRGNEKEEKVGNGWKGKRKKLMDKER